ncbi:hypothetical protein AX14_007357 [Amanita brunnescens Koide BX004]|nr:hypothetical protein AX14_007357 [Amanita brunnescens Koide BX004]
MHMPTHYSRLVLTSDTNDYPLPPQPPSRGTVTVSQLMATLSTSAAYLISTQPSPIRLGPLSRPLSSSTQPLLPGLFHPDRASFNTERFPSLAQPPIFLCIVVLSRTRDLPSNLLTIIVMPMNGGLSFGDESIGSIEVGNVINDDGNQIDVNMEDLLRRNFEYIQRYIVSHAGDSGAGRLRLNNRGRAIGTGRTNGSDGYEADIEY